MRTRVERVEDAGRARAAFGPAPAARPERRRADWCRKKMAMTRSKRPSALPVAPLQERGVADLHAGRVLCRLPHRARREVDPHPRASRARRASSSVSPIPQPRLSTRDPDPAPVTSRMRRTMCARSARTRRPREVGLGEARVEFLVVGRARVAGCRRPTPIFAEMPPLKVRSHHGLRLSGRPLHRLPRARAPPDRRPRGQGGLAGRARLHALPRHRHRRSGLVRHASPHPLGRRLSLFRLHRRRDRRPGHPHRTATARSGSTTTWSSSSPAATPTTSSRSTPTTPSTRSSGSGRTCTARAAPTTHPSGAPTGRT